MWNLKKQDKTKNPQNPHHKKWIRFLVTKDGGKK